MARRIDDIDAPVPPLDGGVLGQDGDAALALQVNRIHHALGHVAQPVEGAGLAQQLIDEGRLAVIHVGDDGDVAERADGVGHDRTIPEQIGWGSGRKTRFHAARRRWTLPAPMSSRAGGTHTNGPND